MSEVTIDRLQIEIEASAESAAEKLERLTASLQRIRAAAKGGVGLTAVSKQVERFNTTMSNISASNNATKAKLQSIADAVKPLADIQKASGLNSTINALKKLPTVTSQLQDMDMDRFAAEIRRVTDALKPLGSEMNKIAAGFSAFPKRIQQIISGNSRLTTSNKKLSSSYGILGTGITRTQLRLGLLYGILRRASGIIGSWIDSSTAYIENINLFRVSMGKYADEAMRFAENAQDALGIDVSEWIRNQGVFKEIVHGFGVAEDAAYSMSKTLTQLGYDLSSYWNISVESAMEKLQSGMTGQTKPLMELGISLHVASLEQTALNLGIEESVSKMTEAQKASLRYITILEKSRNALGDLSRTVYTPANAMRILQTQVQQLTRAIGNLFIPVLIKVLPYVQAFVTVLTEAVQKLAVFLGFELPTIDYSGLDSGASVLSDIEENADSAASAIKNITAGFDELNVIGKGTSGIDIPVTDNSSLGLDLSKWEYDFLGEINNKAKKLLPTMKKILPVVEGIAIAFAGWKLAEALKNLTGIEGTIARLAFSAVTLTIEFAFVKGKVENFLGDTGTWKDIAMAALGITLGAGVMYILWGPVGATIGIGIGIAAIISALSTGIEEGININQFKLELLTLTTAALGGIAGVMASTKIAGLSAASGAVIGLSISSAVALSVMNINAVASDTYSAGSAQSLFSTAVSSVLSGVAGVELLPLVTGGAIAGAAAFGIGLAVGLVFSIVSLQAAADSALRANIEEIFYGGTGVTITEVAEAFDVFAQNIISTHQPIIDSGNRIDVAREQIDNAKSSIDLMTEAVKLSVDTATELLPSLASEFEKMRDSTKIILDETYNNIIMSIAGALRDTITAVGGIPPETLISLIASVGTEHKDAYNSLIDEQKKLAAQYESGTISAYDYATGIVDLGNQMNDLTAPAKEAIGIFDEIRSSIGRINWESASARTDFFDSILSSATSAKQAVIDSADVLEGYIETIRIQAKEPEVHEALDYLSRVGQIYKTEQLSGIQNELNSMFGILQEDIIGNIEPTVQMAIDEWDKMNGWARFFSGSETGADYAEKALNEYHNNFIDPITADILKTMDELGFEGSISADSAFDKIMSALFGVEEIYSTPFGAAWQTTWKNGVTESVNLGLEHVRNNTVSTAESTGNGVTSSFIDGLTAEQNRVYTSLAGISTSAAEAMRNALGIKNGSSTVTESVGKDMMYGWIKGLSDNQQKVATAIIGVSTAAEEAMKNALGINSPSTVFADIGKNTMLGLIEGAENQMKADSSRWDALAKKPAEVFQLINEVHSPSKLFRDEIGANLGLGLIVGIEDTFGDMESVSREAVHKMIEAVNRAYESEKLSYSFGPERLITSGEYSLEADEGHMSDEVSRGVYQAIMSALRSEENQQYIQMDGEVVAKLVRNRMASNARVNGLTPF